MTPCQLPLEEAQLVTWICMTQTKKIMSESSESESENQNRYLNPVKEFRDGKVESDRLKMERIITKRTEARGLIRNNLALLKILSKDLTLYISRLKTGHQDEAIKYVDWWNKNLDEMIRRTEASFESEEEGTKEKGKINTIPNRVDKVPPELKGEDDINACLKVMDDVLQSFRANVRSLVKTQVANPSQMTLILAFIFDNMLDSVKRTLQMEKIAKLPHSQIGTTIIDTIIVANRDTESLAITVENNAEFY